MNGFDIEEHRKQQMDGLFQVFQEATERLIDVSREGYTWPDALADVLVDYGWYIISQDREYGMRTAEEAMGKIRGIVFAADNVFPERK